MREALRAEFEQQVQKAQEESQQRQVGLATLGVGVQIDLTQPHIMNLSEDPSLAGAIKYNLKPGPCSSIQLTSLPPPFSLGQVFIQGHAQTEPILLVHNMRLILGNNHVFKYIDPAEIERLKKEREEHPELPEPPALDPVSEYEEALKERHSTELAQIEREKKVAEERAAELVRQQKAMAEELEKQKALIAEQQRQAELREQEGLEMKRKLESERTQLAEAEYQKKIKEMEEKMQAEKERVQKELETKSRELEEKKQKMDRGMYRGRYVSRYVSRYMSCDMYRGMDRVVCIVSRYRVVRIAVWMYRCYVSCAMYRVVCIVIYITLLLHVQKQVEADMRHQHEQEERKTSRMALVEQEIVRASSQISQANMVSQALNGGWSFVLKLEPFIDPDTKEQDVRVVVEATALQTGISSRWNLSKFTSRLHQMMELYLEYQNDGSIQLPTDPAENPFYDAPQSELVGRALLYFQGLAERIVLDRPLMIINSRGQPAGELTAQIAPCNPDGSPPKDLSDDSVPVTSEDLEIEENWCKPGTRVDFLLKITGAHGLPLHLCQDLYCQYKFFTDQEIVKTTTVTKKTVNPTWDFTRQYTLTVTDDFLEYIQAKSLTIEEAKSLTIEVYATPSAARPLAPGEVRPGTTFGKRTEGATPPPSVGSISPAASPHPARESVTGTESGSPVMRPPGSIPARPSALRQSQGPLPADTHEAPADAPAELVEQNDIQTRPASFPPAPLESEPSGTASTCTEIAHALAQSASSETISAHGCDVHSRMNSPVAAPRHAARCPDRGERPGGVQFPGAPDDLQDDPATPPGSSYRPGC
ncbi:hypothetical protein PAPYR_7348 [Paratrimastix pyriformis]|uniref:C2 domain-containing protein n=1 Tax=Paratrimastix pyriformis TaxID=342808 RepID=A0ABQ8UD42_9EUKA|nr:hypothetical protein PAPYR_7348 [Paratrimastix pyriformis]